jgi:hypothetical protein
VKKTRKAQVEALEERTARLLRRRGALTPDNGPDLAEIIRARLAALPECAPQTREEYDAGTAALRRQVAAASGPAREVLDRLLRLRIAHRDDLLERQSTEFAITAMDLPPHRALQ